MMINQAALEEFKTLYLKEYGVSLSNDQAMDLGTKLIRLIKAVYGLDVPRIWVPKIDRDKKKGLG